MLTDSLRLVSAVPAGVRGWRHSPWLVVGLLWFVALLNYLDRVMIMTMRESLRTAMPMTDEEFALLSAVFLWVYGFFSPIMGYLADRFSRTRVIVASMLVWSVVTWWTGHARSYNELLLTRALMGISEACYIPAALALITDYHRGATRSTATGIHLSGLNFGAALGCLGGVLAFSHEWSYPFRLFGMIGVAYSLVLILLLRDPPREAVTSESKPGVHFLDAIKRLAVNRSFLFLVTIWSLIGFAGWPIHKWTPTYFQEQFHLRQDIAGVWATLTFQVGCFFGMFAGGALADYWSRTRPRARLLVPILGLILAAPALVFVALSPAFGLVAGGLVLFGFARVFTDANMMPIVCQLVDGRYRATAYGVLNAFSCIVGGIAILLGGILRDRGVNVSLVFLISAGGLVLCALMLTRIRLKSGEPS
ncbi:MFS transporter [soil metagenome]